MRTIYALTEVDAASDGAFDRVLGPGEGTATDAEGFIEIYEVVSSTQTLVAPIGLTVVACVTGGAPEIETG